MPTESDVVVGSKWRYLPTRATEGRYSGELTVKAVNGGITVTADNGTAHGITWFINNLERIDQPPEKAGEDVAREARSMVGTRWVWNTGIAHAWAGWTFRIRTCFDDGTNDVLVDYDGAAPWLRESVEAIRRDARPHRLDTPQEAPPAALADVGRLVKQIARQDEEPKCLTTCGPATPCLTTELCRSRDTQERMAYTQTKLSDDKYDYVGKRPRTGPLQPSINGMGSLVGQFVVNVERHRRAR